MNSPNQPASGETQGVADSFPAKGISGIASDAFWGLISNAGGVVGGLASIKVITSLVNTDEYGKATLVLGVIGFVNFLTVNPFFTAHLRVYFDHLRSGSAHRYLRQLATLLMIAGALSVAVYSIVGAGTYLAGTDTYLRLMLPAILFILLQPLFTATVSLLEAHRKFRDMALVNILTKLGQVPLLAALLFTQLSGGASIILAQALVIAPVLLFLRREVESTTHDGPAIGDVSLASLSFVKDALRSVGWPLFFANLLGWLFTTSDRYLLQHYRDISEVGVYVANYGLWSIPYMVLNAWLESVSRPRLYAAAADGNAKLVMSVLRLRLVTGGCLGVAGGLLLFFLSPWIGSYLLGSRYWFSRELVVLIAAAHLIFVVGSSIVSLLVAEKRLTTLLNVTAIAAASNILLNLIFLPQFGILGAGWTTLGSYVIWGALLVGVAFRRTIHLRSAI